MAEKVLMKGNEAIAEAALIAGCRHYFGYPITPQTEIAAYMAKRMPKIGGTFLQAESESFGLNIFDFHRLHHLTHSTVCQNHGSHAVLVSHFKAFDSQISHLLHACRSQNDHMIVTVTAAFGSMEIVGLGRLNTA